MGELNEKIKRKAHVKQSFSLDFLERGTFTEYPYVKNSSGTVYSCIILYNRTAGRGNPCDAIYTHHIKNRTFKVRYTTAFIL